MLPNEMAILILEGFAERPWDAQERRNGIGRRVAQQEVCIKLGTFPTARDLVFLSAVIRLRYAIMNQKKTAELSKGCKIELAFNQKGTSAIRFFSPHLHLPILFRRTFAQFHPISQK